MAKEQLAGSKELRLDSFEMNSGIYFLYNNDELVYIGQAFNISKRIMEHLLESRKSFNKVRYNLVPRESLNDVETTLIKALKPKYNLARTGNCGDYDYKPTSRSTVTFRPVALSHWSRRNGTLPVRIRFTYKRQSFYFPTNFNAFPEQLSKSTVTDSDLLLEMEPILKKCRDAVKYVSSDKSFEFVKNKVMTMQL